MTNHGSQQEDRDPREGLAEEGLLSPLIEDWRTIYIENYAPWFALARDVNRYATWLFQEHQDAGNGGPANAQAPTAVRMYGRAMNAFAASVMLAERGMAIEAAGAVRAIYEVGFWLSLLATDPLKALEALEIDEHDNAIQRELLLREEHPTDAALIAASLKRQEHHAAKLAKRKSLSVKKIAQTMPKRSGYLEYRLVSAFYGHLSSNSLDGLKKRNGKGGVTNILGPFELEIPKALSFALDAMLRSTRYFEVMMKEGRQPNRLEAAARTLLELQAAT
ncbi:MULTISPECIES: DUF5677 domain-containing protein [unclassified Sphingomonas]|jgi:hypothetical protein|uniref:DUF5677 domain-containing protein n=1 Tax=unclassified Sphingomonas TaxID=196159 RepID=UPI002151B422|nr:MULTISPECIES: DUF5677 domain-containing protein [unclassified Sphingomonas]MCR5870012.1 hypothetical protein [Sphingomonas sp. J344]UUX98293.1 hypothetical protein LRS08_11900 [Sphingomonas sp. J315]